LQYPQATLLLPADENPKIAAERLGHSTVVLTLDLQPRFTYDAATNNGEVKQNAL